MNTQAQNLFCQIEALFKSRHLKASFQSLIMMFLKADGLAIPRHSEYKSASALSRFLNQYTWSLRPVLRLIRQESIKQIWKHYPKTRGRRPSINIILDLTSIEKSRFV